jgi:signal recognition particle GTPase
MNFFSRLKDGLAKTRTQIATIVGAATAFDEKFYDALEEALVSADIGLDRSLAIPSAEADKTSSDPGQEGVQLFPEVVEIDKDRGHGIRQIELEDAI